MKRRLRGLLLGAALYVGLPYLLVQVGNLGLVREGRRARRTSGDDAPKAAATKAAPTERPRDSDFLQREGGIY